jgi:SHS2 domain-containing protein
MPYRYERDIAFADIAFEARGRSLEELFIAAADATINVMVENIEEVMPEQELKLAVSGNGFDLLLWSLLQELIFFKDARRLLLRIRSLSIRGGDGDLHCAATAVGEPIDPARHRLCVDVKAVTLHRLSVEKKNDEWFAAVILDL